MKLTPIQSIQQQLEGIEDAQKAVESVSAAFESAIAPGVTFQTAMAELQVATALPAEKMDALADKARQLAVTFGTDAPQAVHVLQNILLQSGSSLTDYPEVIDTLSNSAMTLAKTMGGDVDKAVQTVTTAFNTFQTVSGNPIDASRQMVQQMDQLGDAQSDAAILMDTYTEKQKRMKSTIDDLKIGFFELIEPLTPAMDGISQFADMLFGLGATVQTVMQIMSLGPVRAAIAWVASMAKIVIATVTSASALTAAIGSIPIVGWIALAITAIVALVTVLWNKFAEVRAFFYGMWSFIQTLFTEYYQFVFNVMKAIVEVINPANWFDPDFHFTDVWDKLANEAQQGGENVRNAFGKGWEEGMQSWEADHPKAEGGMKERNKLERSPLLKPVNQADTPATSNVPGSGGNPPRMGGGRPAAGWNGAGSSGGDVRNVTMNVTFNNHFAASGTQNSLQQVAEKVKRELLSVLTDATPVIAG